MNKFIKRILMIVFGVILPWMFYRFFIYAPAMIFLGSLWKMPDAMYDVMYWVLLVVFWIVFYGLIFIIRVKIIKKKR